MSFQHALDADVACHHAQVGAGKGCGVFLAQREDVVSNGRPGMNRALYNLAPGELRHDLPYSKPYSKPYSISCASPVRDTMLKDRRPNGPDLQEHPGRPSAAPGGHCWVSNDLSTPKMEPEARFEVIQ